MSAPERIGEKRLVVGAHYGTLDFIAQRVTAVVLIVYTLILFLGYLFTSDFNYESWRHLFAFKWGAFPMGQVLATLAFISVVWHAWVGVRDIWMDYIRNSGGRLFLQTLTVLWLVGALVFFVQIVWSL
ncbi:MAG TPA: succinate dehydrogenase, hydrophobic membrane anchor protein [Paenalcaligenes sp.]|nr:succinate dehydrogenase, hydrophobic membrane anchor protein [Paenalcaligenes sp.]